MELQNGDLLNAFEPLKGLMEKKLPVKTSLELVALTKKLSPQMEIIGQVRQQLFATYGEPDPKNPAKIKVDPTGPNFPKFAQELGELLSQTCDIECQPVKLPTQVSTVCPSCKMVHTVPLEIDAATLLLLEKFIEIE